MGQCTVVLLVIAAAAATRTPIQIFVREGDSDRIRISVIMDRSTIQAMRQFTALNDVDQAEFLDRAVRLLFEQLGAQKGQENDSKWLFRKRQP
jgi:hypothetical protein